MFGHALELIDKEKPHRLELAPWTLPPRSDAEVTANTIKSLLQTAATVVEQLRKKKRDLVRALNMASEEQERLNDISDPTTHKVPVVSPREIRLWCVLNTVEFHNKIEEKLGQGPVEFKKFFARAPEIVDEGRKAPNTEFPQMPGFEGRSDGDKAKEVTPFNPSVFFFCSGVTEKGQRAHNSVHIGSTQEQLASWPGLWFLRRDTRRISLDASPRLWFDLCQDLSAIETRFSGKAKLFQFREEAMRWRLGLSSNLPTRLTAQDDERLPVLHSCGHHISQAFKQGDVNFFPIDCCYVCKLTIGYAEAKAIRTRTMAEDFNMEGRIKLPWSCAEVAASTWCDDPWYSNEQPTESGESA
ncbi:hypothetical protein CEP53_003144 [Fusarium sp. AF-6]|nr:hypothetical protein CEP53_003144 [Fusarium sp. AF-6]